MPIGVPKVPFRLPGEEDAVRVDVYNRLYRERLLFLGQQVDDEIANQLIGIMMYLNGEDQAKDMYLYANSPGGAVLAGISAYDAMQFVVPDVHTICMGLAASMGSSILAGGEITRRIALPHARVMIHQPASSYYDGQAGECVMEAEEASKLRDCTTKVYAQRTGKPLWVISEDMERDVFLSAEEAQDYGVADPAALENASGSRFAQ
uniref:ATP-dependent Clp protease proteolytic subunit n=1 Tax=Histiopteris incisa TaxID=32090 RepID=A0A3G5CVN1_9MONI|nr:ATP-dependent Clp protease proteolytic subunit [Histiopteris incisa]AYW16716.1 ATP-dependent Clp protease proteolytic subunit [Histiopteris incisa]